MMVAAQGAKSSYAVGEARRWHGRAADARQAALARDGRAGLECRRRAVDSCSSASAACVFSHGAFIAAACCSTVSELANPAVNPRRVCGAATLLYPTVAAAEYPHLPCRLN